MFRITRFAAPCLALLAMTSCRSPHPGPPSTAVQSAPATAGGALGAATGNVLLEEWTGPYGGVPAFDAMELSALQPALEAAMAREWAAVEAIAADPAPPTFENTVVALERAERDLDRVEAYLGVWRRNLSSPELRAIDATMAPRLAEHESRVNQLTGLFQRIEAVRGSDDLAGRPPAERRLVELLHDRFARQGAMLEGDARQRYAAIEGRMAELQTRFAANVLADEEGYVLFLDETELDGLPASFRSAAAAAAAERGETGRYAILNTRSSVEPFLTFSDHRDLREVVWRRFTSRGDNGDEHDNNALIPEILALRHERVRLLGFDSYADWRLADRMAKTPERAWELLETVWSAATARVAEEVADMQAVADAEGAGITVEPWDYLYYAEKVRRDRYDLDSDEVKQYLELERLRQAAFFVAGELFGFEFTPVPEGSVPVFHPDVRVWEVTDRSTGDHVGLWYLDPFARPGKRSGAWATSYRGHDRVDGEHTVLCSNNSNFVKGGPGEPLLVSWTDAETFFHEFGHALHALSSRVAYPTLNTGVRDYTEFQSQLLERWLPTEPVVTRFLVHHETGEPMPPELVARIERAATFNQGYKTAEYLASALLDLEIHRLEPTGFDPDAYEREALARLGMPPQLVMRHRLPHFAHVFSSEGYSAGYYGYIWADVLTADAAEAFAEAPGGFYDRELGDRLVTLLFAPRNAIDPAEAYRTFRGRDPDVAALMRARGFPEKRGQFQSEKGTVPIRTSRKGK